MPDAALRMTDRPHRLCFLSFAALCLALLLVLPLPAQSTWTLVSPTSGSRPPTTATLWGACYGRGQFVAVGENGTILTSPDGLTWTLRPSGTTAWLTSVAYGFNHYLAVGADRTVVAGESGLAVLSPNLETSLSSRIPTTVPPGTHPLSGLVLAEIYELPAP